MYFLLFQPPPCHALAHGWAGRYHSGPSLRQPGKIENDPVLPWATKLEPPKIKLLCWMIFSPLLGLGGLQPVWECCCQSDGVDPDAFSKVLQFCRSLLLAPENQKSTFESFSFDSKKNVTWSASVSPRWNLEASRRRTTSSPLNRKVTRMVNYSWSYIFIVQSKKINNCLIKTKAITSFSSAAGCSVILARSGFGIELTSWAAIGRFYVHWNFSNLLIIRSFWCGHWQDCV